MCSNEQLVKQKDKIEKELNKFFNKKIEQAKDQEKPEEFLEMIKKLKKFVLSGGKRIRPTLFYYGYFIAGGKEKKDAFKASISIELIHSYLLIHDDIIDEDSFRHNNLTMHCRYEKKYKDKFNEKDLKHFGISMAIVAGDLASSLGYEILTCSNFPIDLKIKAIKKLNQIVSNTITGEAMDVILANRLNVSQDDVIKMQGYKTAKYTIEGPLHLGAILAGADEKFLESISEFSIPLGIAFQIQDDIIGVFGKEEKIGKFVGADIREGKKTLLSVKAFEKADSEQLKILNKSFGNRNIDLKEVNAVRKIITDTKSLDYSLEKMEKLIKFSKARLEEIEISKECKKFLLRLADFMIERKY